MAKPAGSVGRNALALRLTNLFEKGSEPTLVDVERLAAADPGEGDCRHTASIFFVETSDTALSPERGLSRLDGTGLDQLKVFGLSLIHI